MGPQQLGIPGGFLCLGRLWRGFWPGGAVLAVLEAQQQVGRPGRYGCRRRDGICMEVPDCPDGRRVGHLRAAAGLCGGVHCPGGGFSADRGPGKGDRGDIRKRVCQEGKGVSKSDKKAPVSQWGTGVLVLQGVSGLPQRSCAWRAPVRR